MNTQQVADRMVQFMKATSHQPDMEALRRWFRSKFPRATEQEFVRAVEVALADIHAEAERHEAELKQLETMGRMFEGLPRGTTLGDAVRIKASQGDPAAHALLRQMDSRASRVREALTLASAEAHPDWEVIPGTDTIKRRKGAPSVLHHLDPVGDLIDWFQTTYPAEARAIEEGLNQ